MISGVSKFNKQLWPWLVCLVLVGGLVYGGYRYYLLDQELVLTKNSLEREIKLLKLQLSQTKNQLAQAQVDNENLQESFESEKDRNDMIASQVEELTDTVGSLDKLSRLDPELLQKYSRVYFLNEHYIPPKLTAIPSNYLYHTTDEEAIHNQVWPFLKRLLEAAERKGIDLRIVSAYRSFDTQSSLKTNYRVVYGSGANQFSADQGYSEHQLGTTIDFANDKDTEAFEGFESTEAYDWLSKNAYRYGFTLSYPPDNDYYIFEPWHWRFVGKNLAEKLHSENIHFYDMNQRQIDMFLIAIFD